MERNPNAVAPIWVRLADAAAFLAVSVRTARRHIKAWEADGRLGHRGRRHGQRWWLPDLAKVSLADLHATEVPHGRRLGHGRPT